MRTHGILMYYSNTGNTQTVSRYAASKFVVPFDLYDIRRDPLIDFSEYNVFCFATFTDCWQPPKLMTDFITSFSVPANAYAFSIFTFGSIPGRCKIMMTRLLQTKGFHVLPSHGIHTPENYPPAIKSGITAEKYPQTRDVAKLNAYIAKINAALREIAEGIMPKDTKLPRNYSAVSLPQYPAPLFRIFTQKYTLRVDASICTACGICIQACPTKSIRIDEKAYISQDTCQSCWSCYNHCPHHAVFAGNLHGEGQYRGFSVTFQSKFK